MQEYDKSSKWLIQHHGDSILRPAGVREIDYVPDTGRKRSHD